MGEPGLEKSENDIGRQAGEPASGQAGRQASREGPND